MKVYSIINSVYSKIWGGKVSIMFKIHKYLMYKTQIIHISLHKFNVFLTKCLKVKLGNYLKAFI
jgi:hypothetical protein